MNNFSFVFHTLIYIQYCYISDNTKTDIEKNLKLIIHARNNVLKIFASHNIVLWVHGKLFVTTALYGLQFLTFLFQLIDVTTKVYSDINCDIVQCSPAFYKRLYLHFSFLNKNVEKNPSQTSDFNIFRNSLFWLQ